MDIPRTTQLSNTIQSCTLPNVKEQDLVRLSSTLKSAQSRARPLRLYAPLMETKGIKLVNRWTQAVNKGEILMRMMLADNDRAGHLFSPPRDASSKFIDLSHIHENEYNTCSAPAENMMGDLSPAFQALGLRTCVEDGGSLDKIQSQHTVCKQRNGELLCNEYGFFNQMVDCKQGVIVAVCNLASAKMNYPPPAEDIPEMKHWSDIACLQYLYSAQLRNVVPAELRYVFRSQITNTHTRDIIYTVAHNTSTKLTKWPGLAYRSDSMEGQALLGTPNGASVAFMLIQHKEQLGHKIVDSITIFLEDTAAERYPSMCFHLKDVFN